MTRDLIRLYAETSRDMSEVQHYMVQAAQPAGGLQQEQHHNADVQLVQTDVQQPHFDNAAHNLQQCGSYMVVNHPSDTPAGNYQYPDGSHMVAVYSDDPDSNSTGAAKWYGSLDSVNDHAALCSDAAQLGEPVWNGQQALQDAAVAKKGAPADVPRHDTPTSVFDIFNSLDISAATSTAPLAAQHQLHQHSTGTHAIAGVFVASLARTAVSVHTENLPAGSGMVCLQQHDGCSAPFQRSLCLLLFNREA